MKNYNEIAEHIFERRDRYLMEQKINRRRRVRLTAVFCFISICSIMAVSILTDRTRTNMVLAAEIEYNLTKLKELDTGTLLSSNPYDYKNDEHYKNIVDMGIAAMIVLNDKYQAGELGGFDAYIAASAIEEIANVNICEITGKDWENAEDFFCIWEEFIASLPETINKIQSSGVSETEKQLEIEHYGIFGEYYFDTEYGSLSQNEYKMLKEYLREELSVFGEKYKGIKGCYFNNYCI